MPIAKKNIPQDFLEQMKTNLTINTDEINEQKESNSSVISNSAETKPSNSPASVQQKESSKKGKYADVMNVRLSNGRRDEIKRFCTNCGVTVTQYLESSFEFLAKEVAAGHIVISKGGISKVE